MIVKNEKDVLANTIRENVTLKLAISENDGAKNFFMRIIEYGEGASSRDTHQHPYEHEIYIIEGSGILVGSEKKIKFQKGDIIYIGPDEEHAIMSDGYLKFICLVPSKQ